MRKRLLAVLLVVFMLSLVGCGEKGKSSKTTIIDEITLGETTADEVLKMWDEKNLIYSSKIVCSATSVVDEFLGYDSYYLIYHEGGDNIVDCVKIDILFHNDDEVKQGNNDITKYLEKKLIKEYSEAVRHQDDSGRVEFIYPIGTVEIGGVTDYICVKLVKDVDESGNYLPEGYSSNYFNLTYFIESKGYLENGGIEIEESEAVVEEY